MENNSRNNSRNNSGSIRHNNGNSKNTARSNSANNIRGTAKSTSQRSDRKTYEKKENITRDSNKAKRTENIERGLDDNSKLTRTSDSRQDRNTNVNLSRGNINRNVNKRNDRVNNDRTNEKNASVKNTNGTQNRTNAAKNNTRDRQRLENLYIDDSDIREDLERSRRLDERLAKARSASKSKNNKVRKIKKKTPEFIANIIDKYNNIFEGKNNKTVKMKSNKVTKFRFRPKFNIGFIVFALILLYIATYTIIYFTKTHISIYEIVENSISDNAEFTGIAVRTEEIIKCDEAGYITYFVGNGSKIAVNDLIFSVNEGGSAYDVLEMDTEQVELSDSDYMKLYEDILYYKEKYSNSTFGNIYNFKSSVKNSIFDFSTSEVYKNLNELIENVGEDALAINKASKSGVISYTLDDMTQITADTVTDNDFKKIGYNYSLNSTGTLLEKEAPAYRLVTEDDWSVVIKLTEEQYKKLSEKKSVNITFLKNNYNMDADIRTYSKDKGFYAELMIEGYMVNYIDDRYIDLIVHIDSAKGLKIPNTAIFEKEFYIIPDEYFKFDEESQKYGLLVQKYDSKGKKTTEFVETVRYYSDDTKDDNGKVIKSDYYVDDQLFDIGTQIEHPVSGEKYEVNKKKPLNGVYCVNKGFCEFRRVDIIYKGVEYTISKSGSESDYSVANYDHIILDATLGMDDELIF